MAIQFLQQNSSNEAKVQGLPTEDVTRTVRVRFDPSRIEADPISVEPELVQVSSGCTTVICFELESSDAALAAFPPRDFIRTEGREGLEAVYEEPRRVKLCIGNADQSKEAQGKVPYEIRVEYGGEVYTSHGYPGYEDRGPDT